jgi:ribosomal protein S24E
MTDPLEALWNDLLSRRPERIQTAFRGLPTPQRLSVRAHLIKMKTEPGWQPEQVQSATIALDAIKDIPDL